jgi:hypothetical protein
MIEIDFDIFGVRRQIFSKQHHLFLKYARIEIKREQRSRFRRIIRIKRMVVLAFVVAGKEDSNKGNHTK